MGSGFLIDNVKDTSMVKSSKSRDLEEKLKASVNKSNITDPNGHSIADLSKSQKQKLINEEKNSFVFLHSECTAFRFRGTGGIEKGQYRIPFIMKLP